MAFELKNKVAVLTGAASGIGAALAVQLAQKGARLALIDRNGEGLAAVRQRIPGSIAVSCHTVDLADRLAVKTLPEAILAAHGGVNLLINNAGAALAGPFESYGNDDFEWLMNINFWAGAGLTKAFLPTLHQAPQAHIVYVSSVYGLIGVPGNVAYCASKFAIRGFAEALRQELRMSGIGITVVHPGGVNTNIARGARIAEGTDPELAKQGIQNFQKALRLPPEKAAAIIIRGIEGQKRRVLIGTDARVIDILQRFAPWLLDKIIAKLAESDPALTR